MQLKIIAFCVLASVLASFCSAGEFAVIHFGKCAEFEVVQSFNLTSYMGVWYEIKRFPVIFEKDMTCVRATYKLISGKDSRKVFQTFFINLN